VLLVELRDLDRVRPAERPHEIPRLADEVEQALASELGAAADGREPGLAPWSGALTRERTGRYWLLAPETDRSEARMLAERLIAAVRRLAGECGIDLEVAVGAAVCPDDGREAAELAAHADLELYAARASSRTTPSSSPAVDEPA
jgi:GGDEF domain-containing protein